MTRSGAWSAKHLVDRCLIGKVAANEGIACAVVRRDPVEFGEAGLLEGRVVIVVDVVDADYGIAARDQFGGGVETNEAGGAGDENFHGAACLSVRF